MTASFFNRRLLYMACAVVFFTACKKKVEYTYEVNDVTVQQEGADKPNLKTTTEFISIAYSDLFGKTISNGELNQISTSYEGFGDQKLIGEMIIKNFLKKPGVIIPSVGDMKKDLAAFIQQSYKKFYGREASAFEVWNLSNMISNNASITPELIYFSMMTSTEYRYY
jgi:hypothetical protein